MISKINKISISLLRQISDNPSGPKEIIELKLLSSY